MIPRKAPVRTKLSNSQLLRKRTLGQLSTFLYHTMPDLHLHVFPVYYYTTAPSTGDLVIPHNHLCHQGQKSMWIPSIVILFSFIWSDVDFIKRSLRFFYIIGTPVLCFCSINSYCLKRKDELVLTELFVRLPSPSVRAGGESKPRTSNTNRRSQSFNQCDRLKPSISACAHERGELIVFIYTIWNYPCGLCKSM